MELAFGARLPGNTPQRHEADPPGIGINQRSITTTTWHSPELAAHGSPGATPRRLGNPPTGFLSCKPQMTASPRSPDVYRDPRLSPDVYQELLLFRDPSAETGQPTQTQRDPSPGFVQARGAYLNSPLSCGPIPGLYPLKPGSLQIGSPTCQPR